MHVLILFGKSIAKSATLFFAAVLFILPLSSGAQDAVLESTQTSGATIGFSPATGEFGNGKNFVVTVSVDSSKPFNAVSAVINFDPAILSVEGVSKTTSALSLWAVEPAYSNSAGTVSFDGGNTTPLTGKKTIVTITFKPKKEGDAKISFDKASVLAADGKGTDILSVKTGSTYAIIAGTPEVRPPPPDTTNNQQGPAGPLPDAPEIASATHPKEDQYSNAEKAKFSWELPFDVTVVRLNFDKKSNTTPTTGYDPAISEKEYDNLSDGVMYVHLRFKNDAGWGPITHRKILIDRTPPGDLIFSVKTSTSSSDIMLTMNASDTLSGIDHYELAVDDGSPTKVTVGEVKTGQYMLTGQSAGKHKIVMSVFDKAGNEGTKEESFTMTYDVAAEAAKKTVDEAEQKPTDWRLIGEIALIALIAFLVGYLWYERNAFRHEKFMIKREADELRDNTGNIFAAMREEITEQLGRLYQKPNPSPEDRQVTENVNEALDLSEELMGKELEDVRKLLM